MILRQLKLSAEHELIEDIESNLDKYRNGNFHYLSQNRKYYRPLGAYEVEEDMLAEVNVDRGGTSDDNLNDIENSITVFDAFSDLSPHLARDTRLWSYYTHTSLLEYSRSRWLNVSEDKHWEPNPDCKRGNSKKSKYCKSCVKCTAYLIKVHFFSSATNVRSIERSNAVSRLWWNGFLAARISTLDMEDALNALMATAEVRSQIMERPTTAQSMTLLSELLLMINEGVHPKPPAEGDKPDLPYSRDYFRAFMRKLNNKGGSLLLEYLDQKECRCLLESCL
jgi:hypothetical protein